MSATQTSPPVAPLPPVEEPKNYLNIKQTIASWLLTVDHKRICLMYMVSITLFFAVGGFGAMLIRLELLTPQGDFMTADGYNKSFTLHGIMMVFFFLIPSIPATLGNFLVPIMVGAKDVAFPRLNLLSWYVFMGGAVMAVTAVLLGGVDTGWTFYTPYSSTYANGSVIIAGLAAFVAGFSSILTGLNFVVTIHKMRAPGLTWYRMPLFMWAIYSTSVIQILGTPVVAITLVMMVLERGLGFGFFDPRLGGDPILFQHLFWFYSHPAVYIMILPGLGVISEVISGMSRRKVFGYHFVAFSSVAIAMISFIVWGHHMFTSGQSVYAGMVFSFLTFLVAIPSAIKVFNWLGTMYQGSILFATPMIYALGFLGLFAVGGLTGLFLSSLGTDLHMHDTYFVVAHFHYIMVGGAVMAMFAGLHYWWPKISGRMYPEPLGQTAAALMFFGFNFTFFPQFLVGYLGMPRRYYAYPEEMQIFNILSSIGSSILAIGYILPVIYLTWSWFYGPKASQNPWGVTGLEWEEMPSPPPTENFTHDVVVTKEPYSYAKEAH